MLDDDDKGDFVARKSRARQMQMNSIYGKMGILFM